ncbi:YjfB family protein [Clostridium beijerinckii]|jgi:hypothetical protein|uniref:YjfB family protein n=1 Tax=Clostridium beijerinckii TaxID=1520 RepID=UPI001361B71B|nr:YjfB family protein [Clostridium beijerinckii]MZK49860.1 putative motility protein [Clostridium beijerinckii]MZK57819.1 putative motility protein [Clostridium beijerinckii]MZK68030.1 putative motility protein [Clostridium beijerinckii]MZK73527.1 putative motility protein [Clostridium beijerinckii]MZK83110.1 putative motility protein [Clostridium beijerinckii]
MDIAQLSIIMSQARVQESAGIQLAKITMDTEKETANQMTQMIGNVAVDPNLGNNIDVSV